MNRTAPTARPPRPPTPRAVETQRAGDRLAHGTPPRGTAPAPTLDDAATKFVTVGPSDERPTTCRPSPALDDAATRFLQVAQAKSAVTRSAPDAKTIVAVRRSAPPPTRLDDVPDYKTTVAVRRESQVTPLPKAATPPGTAPAPTAAPVRSATPNGAAPKAAALKAAAPNAAAPNAAAAGAPKAAAPNAAAAGAPKAATPNAGALGAPKAAAPNAGAPKAAAPNAGAPKAAAPNAAAAPKAAAPKAAPAPAPPAPLPIPSPVEALPIVRDTPELFALLRRVALQSDVTNAAGVLHAGLGELVFARVALAVISTTGVISCPIPQDMADAAKVVRVDAIAGCAQQRKILGTDRYLLVPIPASVPAVLVVWRTPDAPPLDAAVATLAVAAASRLTIIDHFLATQAAQQQQSAADAKSVFRPQALSASRAPHRVGDLVNLSPRWVRLALPVMLGVGILLVVAAALIPVPSYSRGTVVVRTNGHNVISNAQGRIADVLVVPGQRVVAGEPLIVLDTTAEQQAFAQIDTVYRDQLGAFLVDPSDEAARQSLAGIMASHTSAKETLVAKTITAPVGGIVGAVLASDTVSAGEHVLTIIPDGSESTVVAFMPGNDLARIKVGMTLQVAMSGYTHKRVELEITEVGDEVISQLQARKQLGQKLADAIRLPPSTVIVKAKLKSDTFEAGGKAYPFRDGMDGIGEVATDTRSLLAMILHTSE